RQKHRTAQDRATDHVTFGALGSTRGNRLADHLARQRRGFIHHRRHADGRWRPFGDLKQSARGLMSALGHKRTLHGVRSMSALPPIADIAARDWMSVKCHKRPLNTLEPLV